MQQQGMSDLLLTIWLFFQWKATIICVWHREWAEQETSISDKYYSHQGWGFFLLLIWILDNRRSCPRNIFFLIKTKFFSLRHKRYTKAGRSGKMQFTACQISKNVLLKRSCINFLKWFLKQLWCNKFVNLSLCTLNKENIKPPLFTNWDTNSMCLYVLSFLIRKTINHDDFVYSRRY